MSARGAGWEHLFRKRPRGFVLRLGKRRYWNGQTDSSLGYERWFTNSPRRARLFETRAEAYSAAADAAFLQNAKPEEHWE